MPVIPLSKPIQGSVYPKHVTGAPANGTYTGTPKGGVVVDNATGIHYSNTGTAAATVWTAIGSQS